MTFSKKEIALNKQKGNKIFVNSVTYRIITGVDHTCQLAINTLIPINTEKYTDAYFMAKILSLNNQGVLLSMSSHFFSVLNTCNTFERCYQTSFDQGVLRCTLNIKYKYQHSTALSLLHDLRHQRPLSPALKLTYVLFLKGNWVPLRVVNKSR